MTISNHQNIPSSAINTVKPPYITMAIFAIIGFVLLFGGIYLISLGGSWYYLVAGLWILATAVLLKKTRCIGAVAVCCLIGCDSSMVAMGSGQRFLGTRT